MSMSTPRRTAAAAFAAGALLLSACGSDGGDESDSAEAGSSAAPGADLPVLFEDSMTDDGNGWGEADDENFTTAFTSDGYSVALNGSGDFFGYADDGPRDVGESYTTIEFDDSGLDDPDRHVGVSCRIATAGVLEYYALTINNRSGTYEIVRYSAEDPENPVLLAHGDDPSLEGLGKDGPAQVTGSCLGEGDGGPVVLTLTAGGNEIATATDEDGLGSGTTGIAVGEGPTGVDTVPATFTFVEIRGAEASGSGDAEESADEDADEGSGGEETVLLSEDFSDPTSGIPEVSTSEGDGLTAAGYTSDGSYIADTEGLFDAVLPLTPPLPDVGTASVDMTADVSDGYAGLCLGSEDGQYEFAIGADGYASLGLYPADGSDFVIIDEANGDFDPLEAPVRITAGWNTDGASTNLDIYADGELLASGTDDTITSFTGLALCATVSDAAPAGSSVTVTYRDLEVVGEL